MTLIPLMSALTASSRRIAEPASGRLSARYGYDAGGGYRPVAAALAVGLPVALVVAVALSPMIIDHAPVLKPMEGTLIELPKPPPPPPDPVQDAKPTLKSASATEAVKPIVDTFPPTDLGTEVKPFIPDPTPFDPGPATEPADPPMPKLVLAELDSRFAGSFQPDYPASEQRREIEGRAKVRVLIGTDGRVKAVEQISSDSPGFFEETKRRALSKWRFKPATRGGVAEESWKVMTVTFQIRNG